MAVRCGEHPVHMLFPGLLSGGEAWQEEVPMQADPGGR